MPMPAYGEHAITLASFEQIDREVGTHAFTEAEYAVVRRVIHTTADFEFKRLMRFGHQPFESVGQALRTGQPIVTDVSMVAAGIGSVVAKTWDSPVTVAVQQVSQKPFNQQRFSQQRSAGQIQTNQINPYQTRSAAGMRQCAQTSPEAIFAIGNAPTALLALCEGIERGDWRPALVIGAPVGFINVVESKQALTHTSVPHILVSGRKGGSAVAAAILNALMIWTWERQSE